MSLISPSRDGKGNIGRGVGQQLFIQNHINCHVRGHSPQIGAFEEALWGT